MTGLIAWWVRNAVAANLLMVFILVCGLLAWAGIEKEVQPVVKLPLVQVSLTWPGASPKEIEQQVIQRVALHVEREPSRFISSSFCFRQSRKPFSYRCECACICRRVRSRCASYWPLIDIDYLV